MTRVGFPTKDLKRRGFHTLVTVLALSLCVAVMVSTVIVAQNYGLHVTAILGGSVNIGFVSVFSGFATVVTYLSILTGGLITFFFASANMRVRVKDIGIMKAAGCIPDQAFGYFAVELLLLVVSSCGIGVSVGLLSSYSLSSVIGQSLPESNVSVALLAVLEVSAIFAVVSLLLGIRPIAKALQEKPAETLFPYHLRGVSFKSGRSPITRLGVSFRIAYRSFLRRKTVTLSTVVCLSLALASATIAFGGTVIANQTTRSYIGLGIGENIIAVGHQDMIAKYTHFLTGPLDIEKTPMINYSASVYAIPQSVIDDLSAIADVEAEPRFLQETSVLERPLITIIDMQYFIVGDSRSSDAVVIGVDPEHMVINWLIEGRTLSRDDKSVAVVGDSLASKILSSPFDQKVTILGRDFQVVGVALDPVNTGFVVYVPLSVLTDADDVSYNLVLLRLSPYAYSQALGEVAHVMEGTGLSYAELNPLLERYRLFFEPLWSSFALVSLFFLIVIVLCLFTLITLYITEQEPELAIMRALGAKPRKIVTIVMAQAAITVLVSSVVGISLGLLVIFTFLIRSPAVLPSDLTLVGAWLLMAIGVLCITSLLPALRIARKPLARIVPKL